MHELVYKSLSIPVWIRAPGSPLYQCAMTSASEYFGELMVHDPFAMPDRFDLFFSPIAQSWRECSIITRRYGVKSIRIRFLARHLPLYRGQHRVQGLQIPHGPNRAAQVELPPNRRINRGGTSETGTLRTYRETSEMSVIRA
jgi:hypothetical protein